MSTQPYRSTYPQIFACCEELQAIAREMIEKQPVLTTPKDGIAGHMMAKSYKTFGRVLADAYDGYGEDAQMRARSLFDAYLVIGNVLEDKTEDTAMQFLNFDDMTRVRMHRNIKDRQIYADIMEERTKNPRPNQEKIEDVQARAEQWVTKYGKGYRSKWYTEATIGKTIGDIANRLQMKPFYETAYTLQSQLEHSEPRSGDQYLRDDGERLWMKYEPSEWGIDLALVSAFSVFLGTVSAFDEHFGFGMEPRLQELILVYKQAVEDSHVL